MANISGKRIKDARKKMNMDQIALSAALDVEHNINISQSDISEIERQVRGLKYFELEAIANILEVEPEWLLRGDKIPDTYK